MPVYEATPVPTAGTPEEMRHVAARRPCKCDVGHTLRLFPTVAAGSPGWSWTDNLSTQSYSVKIPDTGAAVISGKEAGCIPRH